MQILEAAVDGTLYYLCHAGVVRQQRQWQQQPEIIHSLLKAERYSRQLPQHLQFHLSFWLTGSNLTLIISEKKITSEKN